MSSTVLTSLYKIGRAREFINSVSNGHYYVFMGDSIPNGNNSSSSIVDNLNDQLVDVYRHMIQGKLVGPNDIKLSIRNIPYIANTVYDMYDDQADDLSSKDFYVCVNEESFYHIYKCLDNNLGARSTAMPTFAHISGGNNAIYQTSDGYRWKYMYSVDSTTHLTFSSDAYIPLVVNTAVTTEAISGAIDIIKIEVDGRGYDNFITGSFKTGDIRINSNTKVYGISSTDAPTVNGFYTGCNLYISSGPGVGENRKIVDYISNIDGNFIVLDESLTSPLNGSEFEIYPSVAITNDDQTVNAVGRALVNALASNSIFRIELFERGAGYDFQYVSANVVANDAVAVSEPAELRVIYSPPNGHGYDPAKELYANVATMCVTVVDTESNTLLATNQFRQIGIIANPKFNNVKFHYIESNNSFYSGETVYKFNKIKITDNASMNTTSVVISSSDGAFDEQLEVGEMFFIQTDDESQQQLMTVASITNATSMNCESNGLFASTSCKVYKINIQGTAVVTDLLDSTHFYANSVDPVFGAGDVIVGAGSGKSATINSISRNDVTKGFSTFIQLFSYKGAMVAGTFVDGESVSQGNSQGILFTAALDGSNAVLYVSNQQGLFSGSATIIGETSDAVFSLDTVYRPELSYRHGDIIYLENLETPIQRNATESEKFQINFEF